MRERKIRCWISGSFLIYFLELSKVEIASHEVSSTISKVESTTKMKVELGVDNLGGSQTKESLKVNFECFSQEIHKKIQHNFTR